MSADRPPRAPVTLDVALTVGATTHHLGTITADTPAEAPGALAGLLRAAADGIEIAYGLDDKELT